MARRFVDLPQAVTHAFELAQQLDFTLADLGYRFPDFPLPTGETPSSYLRQITWNHARARFRPLSARAQAQLGKELAMIEKLGLAGYFLIVWDIVEFCRREKILCQGRGSAANSAVCYALGITAIDPVKMELLFERFLSEERGEWPDIDLDLPSGDPREKVIQYVYRRYGGEATGGSPHAIAAAMTANVITYRDRSAAREVAKALGFSREQEDRLAKQLGHFRYDLERGDPKLFERELATAGFDPEEPRNRLFGLYWRKIQNLPRHLGQHSGGMVIAAGRLDEVVPLEPAAMPGRTIVQWDKDDCADLGIIKVDLLGLGMLNALEEAIPIIRENERVSVDLAHLPADDPKVYAMLRAADTVGVFQVESRAQMASLPSNAPTRFYDLVIQVAIIRPGPITGGMVHPFFERRRGREKVTYFDPCLEPILKRTLGIPLFQEQLLRIAMTAAGFSGGEAEELRRAMGFKRSVERMEAIEARLRSGMAARGITGANQDQIVQSITSFALYGFPESHAASFALIAYASAYLKCYHPTAFLISLLNAWPMGFYHPASLVKDAQRHGVAVLPIDVNFSGWRCLWEELKSKSAHNEKESAPSSVRACGAPAGSACATSQGCGAGRRTHRGGAPGLGPFTDVEELKQRTALRSEEMAQPLGGRGARLPRAHPPRGALAGGARRPAERGAVRGSRKRSRRGEPGEPPAGDVRLRGDRGRLHRHRSHRRCASARLCAPGARAAGGGDGGRGAPSSGRTADANRRRGDRPSTPRHGERHPLRHARGRDRHGAGDRETGSARRPPGDDRRQPGPGDRGDRPAARRQRLAPGREVLAAHRPRPHPEPRLPLNNWGQSPISPDHGHHPLESNTYQKCETIGDCPQLPPADCVPGTHRLAPVER